MLGRLFCAWAGSILLFALAGCGPTPSPGTTAQHPGDADTGAAIGSDIPDASATDYTALVNVFTGTRQDAANQGTGGGAGNTFPGPALPFGMIKFGPDTLPAANNMGGGYDYGDTRIRGFSLMRYSGAGCPGYRDVPITPTTAAITQSPVSPLSLNTTDAYIAQFSHQHEQAQPGYYAVTLNPDSAQPIAVELTATTRTGAMRIHFPPGTPSSLLFNLGGSATGARQGHVQIDPRQRTVSGWVESGDFCSNPQRYRLYFVAQADVSFGAYGTWEGQRLEPGATAGSASSFVPSDSPLLPLPSLGIIQEEAPLGGNLVDTAQTGAYVTFDAGQAATVGLRVGVSFVSVANAQANLDAESKGRTFDAMREAAHQTWDQWLGRVAVEGGSTTQRRSFYTALYHSLVTPTTFSDANGQYAGMDGAVHQVAAGRTDYTDISGWDIYRSQIQWLAIMAPGVASDIVWSMMQAADQSGWLPKWPSAGQQTNVMVGDPADAIIASAWALGARDFDVQKALAAMIKGATQTGISRNDGYVERPGLQAYLKLGYIPYELNANQLTQAADNYRRAFALASDIPGLDQLALVWGTASTTLEYANDDFAIASLARATGDPKQCQAFLKRSANWKNVFDPSIGAMRPKLALGLWLTPYDPAYSDAFSSLGFVEGNGDQYTWMVPFDIAGLRTALGGRKAMAERLDAFFTQLNAGFASPYAFLSNEPTFYSPWLYDWIGEPTQTQGLLWRVITTLFNDGPGGLPGNDDLGALSAWQIFAMLGAYPFIPGQDIIALSTPMFPKVTLHRAGGDIVIEAPGVDPDTPQFVQALTLDDAPITQPWLHFTGIADGGTLRFTLTGDPDSNWGTDPHAAPPSFPATDGAFCPDPLAD